MRCVMVLLMCALLSGLTQAGTRGATEPAQNVPEESVAAAKPQQVEVVNFPATQNVAGNVNVGNLPAVQAIGGSVSVTNLPLDAQGNVRVAAMVPSTVMVEEYVTLLSTDGCQAGTERVMFHDFPSGGPWRRVVVAFNSGVTSVVTGPRLYFTAVEFPIPTFQCFDTALLYPSLGTCSPPGNQPGPGATCAFEPVGNRLVILYTPSTDETPWYGYLRWEK